MVKPKILLVNERVQTTFISRFFRTPSLLIVLILKNSVLGGVIRSVICNSSNFKILNCLKFKNSKIYAIGIGF